MSEYVKRESLIERFKELGLGENSFIERVFADGAYSVLESFPSADVAPIVHGKLIDNKYCVFCSVCGYHWYHCDDRIQEFNYCPNCGAKMDLED